MAGLHHAHLKKHLYKKIEGAPNRESLKRTLDKMMVGIALIGPLATIPQVFQLYHTKDAQGLSIETWVLWTILSGVWCVYGYLHRETPIALSNIIYVILQGAVVIGILLYT